MPGPNPVLVATRPRAKFGPKLRSLEERFEEKFSLDAATGCWVWAGCANGKLKYGMLYDRDTGKKELAHRVAWKLMYGKYPELPLLHRCDNPSCVNPDHLFPGTQKDNMIDKAQKKRSSNGNRAATELEAAQMRAMYNEGYRQGAIGACLGFDQTYVSRVLAGKIIKLR